MILVNTSFMSDSITLLPQEGFVGNGRTRRSPTLFRWVFSKKSGIKIPVTTSNCLHCCYRMTEEGCCISCVFPGPSAWLRHVISPAFGLRLYGVCSCFRNLQTTERQNGRMAVLDQITWGRSIRTEDVAKYKESDDLSMLWTKYN